MNRLSSFCVKSLFAASAALFLLSFVSSAQLNLGSISGSVTDPTGAVVPNASVTVLDQARGVTRTLTTDSAGEYAAPSLVPGDYTVRATAPGFSTSERKDIAVGVGQALRIDLGLQTGQQNQTISVEGTPPIVNTTSAMISTTIETKAIEELPLSGRLYTKLLDYTPGVAGRPGGNTPTYSSNGAGTMANMWMLDGVDDVNQFAASGPLFGATTSADELSILPLDSIQEINVIANPKAEFGWEQGAVLNVGLKSGTNALHGSAYAYGRYTGWDARSPYLGPLPKADDEFKQFGASIGGPIIKDKLFYFGNYEGFRYTVGSPGILQVPTSGSLGGDTTSFPDAIKDLNANGVPLNQLSLNLAGCTAQGVCDPHKGIFTNGTSSPLLSSGLDNIGRSDNMIVKMDYRLNDKNTINGEYLLGNATDQTAGVGLQPYWANTDHNRVMVVRGVWVYVPSSNLVNEARFGYDRYNLQDYNAECTQNLGQPDYLKAFGFASGINAPSPECGFPVINIGNFAATGAGQFIQDQLVFQNTYHYLDSVSWVRGKHQMKFGVEFHHTYYNGYGAPNYLDGNVQFLGGAIPTYPTSTPLEDFLAGFPTNGQFLKAPPLTTTGFNRYAGYFMDDWRITSRLTLNLGLRYEYEPPLVDANNAFGNFDPNTPTGMIQQTNGNALYKTDKRDFGPRIGFAWDVTGKGTTVIRAGTSIAYDTTPMDALVTFQGASLPTIPTGATLYNADGTVRQGPGNIQASVPVIPGNQLNWVYNAPGAPVVPVFNTASAASTCGNGLPVSSAPDAPLNPAPCSLLAKAASAPRSYMTTWTVGVQHAFTNNISLNAAYVGNHADGLPEYVNVNQPTPGPNDYASEQQRRPYYGKYPYFSNILVYSNVGWSNYHSLQLSLIARNYHGLTLAGSYTLADAHTTQSGESDNFPFLKDSTNMASSYAPMNSTPRHHLGITLTYAIPGKKGYGQILQGWAINSAFNFLSGVGVDLNDFVTDFAGTGTIPPFQGAYWNLFGNPDDFSRIFGRTTPVPFFSGSNVPAACTNAASSEPTNPSVPGSSGLASLAAFGCYMAGKSVIVPPAFGTNGNMYRNEITGAPFHEWNFSVTKDFRFFERVTAQYRFEAFNITNSRNYGPASGEPLFSSSFGVSTSPVTAGNPVNGTGDDRRIQMGLKFSF
ncbi:MAG TPA: carboxypeptidase regulatory-like domain-containing protein [Bryobacteraceae bacterium]|nr:carboxypeptidase regulatory-like domain-containing protein [Bryobacteraceae bacterium]